MREALATAAKTAGCEIRVLTMDAKNPAFGYMINPEVAGSSYSSQPPPDYSETRLWFKSALEGASNPRSEVRALTKGMIAALVV